MKYELAKALMDAGFKFTRIEAGMCVGPWPVLDMNPSGDQAIGAQHFYAPTLAELIAACGEKFVSLVKHDDWSGWTALKTGDTFDEGKHSEGAIPEEAVANLWLSLNPPNAKEA